MLKYLQEIKIRLFLLFLTWLFTVLISYAYKEVLLCVILQVTENYNSDFYFIFTNVWLQLTTVTESNSRQFGKRIISVPEGMLFLQLSAACQS